MAIDEKSFDKMCNGCARCNMNEYNYDEICGTFDKEGVFYPNYCPMKVTKTMFPKEAWYDGRIAKQVIDDVYYVWRGEWSDPIYVVAYDFVTTPVFGKEIVKGTEINYYDVWGDDEKLSKEEIAERCYDFVIAMETEGL